MNRWTKLSVEYANQRSYLDDLFRVYPTIPDGIRNIDKKVWRNIEFSFQKQDNINLIKNLLKLDLFPIKDSYVAYLRKDKTAIERNPGTIDRLSGRIYDMGLDEVYKKCSEPKETNRQIGPMFKEWIDKGSLGKKPLGIDEFINTSNNFFHVQLPNHLLFQLMSLLILLIMLFFLVLIKKWVILQKIIVDMNMLETLIKV